MESSGLSPELRALRCCACACASDDDPEDVLGCQKRPRGRLAALQAHPPAGRGERRELLPQDGSKRRQVPHPEHQSATLRCGFLRPSPALLRRTRRDGSRRVRDGSGAAYQEEEESAYLRLTGADDARREVAVSAYPSTTASDHPPWPGRRPAGWDCCPVQRPVPDRQNARVGALTVQASWAQALSDRPGSRQPEAASALPAALLALREGPRGVAVPAVGRQGFYDQGSHAPRCRFQAGRLGHEDVLERPDEPQHRGWS